MSNDQKEVKKEVKEVKKEPVGFYKGYDIKWLKDNPDHVDFGLVAEYEAKNGEVK